MSSPLQSAALRAFLIFLGVVLVGLVIWFIGPLLAFGELRPLATAGMRVTLIAFVVVLAIFMLLEWTLSVLAVAALCLLIWNAGPLLSFGSAAQPIRPLAGDWPRALLIAVILVIYLVWALYKLWHMIRNDEAFAKRVLGLDKKNKPQTLAKDEIRQLQGKAQRALAELRQMRLSMAGHTGSVVAFLRRLVEGKRYLYELPWFMIIGKPGAGKSSVLTNAGLTFALAEQMQAAANVGLEGPDRGTLNCNWWFTNEAVLIDTAGRYTAPDDSVAPRSPDVENLSASPEAKNQAEWQGFLGVLRKARTRAPINGALLAIDIAEICRDGDAALLAHAAHLRARLGELRQQLGIRFPVYVLLTKCDILRGFNAYFAPMGKEARSQVWGFTLPLEASSPRQEPRGDDTPATQRAEEADPRWSLRERIDFELQTLQRRIEAGTATRLQEEYELDKRQALYLLPHEMQALLPRLSHLLDAVFADNRFDTTQHQHMLRGVYFTSAAQPQIANAPSADHRSLVSRLLQALRGAAPAPQMQQVAEGGHGSYFIADAMRKIVFAESHLVRPNLRWEARFKLLRLLGHALVLLFSFWLLGALLLSHDNNRTYLNDVGSRTEQLRKRVAAADVAQHPERIADLLTDAHQLALHTGLDLAAPAMAYQYGLYAAPPVVVRAQSLYDNLQDRMVLPVLLRRMAYRLQQAMANKDEVDTYDTLRSYLLLNDAERFQSDPQAAADLRAWVVKDWQLKEAPGALAAAAAPPLSESFGNSAAMLEHLQLLFSGNRVIRASSTPDAALVKQAREFLENRSTSTRLYDRAKRSVASEVGQDFSLVRALGPQAGTMFRRESGESLESGVPGLFTYDGYHDLFAKRLRELVTAAAADDAWVMGRDAKRVLAEKKTLDGVDPIATLIEDVRRQYLQEYVERWDAFLGDVRLGDNAAGENMSFEVGLVRQLAAADSPLARLAKQAARETTLSRPLIVLDNSADKSVFDKAADALDSNASKLGQSLGLRPEQRMERLIVDDHFAGLREAIVGQPDAARGPVTPPGIGAMSSVLSEFYTTLVVAQAAIEGGALPPATVESANKLRIQAEALPAPLHKVLLDVSSMGRDKIAHGAETILRGQARAQLDRLQGLMAMMVTEPCRRQIAGRYPFVNTSEEVAADDFNAFFAAGGAADSYFAKYLQSLVDTSVRPWRYKSPETANYIVGTEALAEGKAPAPAATGPTLLGETLRMLSQSGPNPEVFAQAQAIREAYFREPGAKRLSWKQELRVASLDPSITELVIDVDGQVLRYAHGPVQSWVSTWPGPRGGLGLDISVQPRLRPETAQLQLRGPWAPLRLLDRATVLPGASAGRVGIELSFDGRRALLDLQTSGINPLSADLLHNFKCPGA